MLQAPVNMLGILPLLCQMGMGHTLLRLVPQLHHTVKTEVCIPYLGYAPCNSRGMYFIYISLVITQK